MKIKKNINGLKAFTLIEIIVATAITAIIAISIISLFLQSTVLNTEIKKQQAASKIGQNHIEELRNMHFSEMINQSEDISIPELPNGRRITTIKPSYRRNQR